MTENRPEKVLVNQSVPSETHRANGIARTSEENDYLHYP